MYLKLNHPEILRIWDFLRTGTPCIDKISIFKPLLLKKKNEYKLSCMK